MTSDPHHPTTPAPAGPLDLARGPRYGCDIEDSPRKPEALVQWEYIDDPSELPQLARALAQARHVGLDSESNSMHAYNERVCLVQLSIDDRYVLIDPIAFAPGSNQLQAIAGPLEDPQRPIVVHGGEYDVAVFKREFGISLTGLYDTQQAASILGWPRTGLATLVETICGVRLGKTFARHDWGRRPIPQAALEYAIHDVLYLKQLHEHMKTLVADADLEDELAVANASVEASAAHNREFDPAAFWKIKGAKELDPAGQQRLQALFAWRERAARADDRPPGMFLNPKALLSLARTPPTSVESVRSGKLPGPIRRRHAQGLMRALDKAADEALLAAPESTPKPPRAVAERKKRLEEWRRTQASARGRTLQAVLPSRALLWLAQYPERDWREAPFLGDKRLSDYAETWRKLLDAKQS